MRTKPILAAVILSYTCSTTKRSYENLSRICFSYQCVRNRLFSLSVQILKSVLHLEYQILKWVIKVCEGAWLCLTWEAAANCAIWSAGCPCTAWLDWMTILWADVFPCSCIWIDWSCWGVSWIWLQRGQKTWDTLSTGKASYGLTEAVGVWAGSGCEEDRRHKILSTGKASYGLTEVVGHCAGPNHSTMGYNMSS